MTPMRVLPTFMALVVLLSTAGGAAAQAPEWDDVFGSHAPLGGFDGRGDEELRREGHTEIRETIREITREKNDEYKDWLRLAAGHYKAERQVLAAQYAAAKTELKAAFDAGRLELRASCADSASLDCSQRAVALAATARDGLAAARERAHQGLEKLRADVEARAHERRAAIEAELRAQIELAIEEIACHYLDAYGVRLQYGCPHDDGDDLFGDMWGADDFAYAEPRRDDRRHDAARRDARPDERRDPGRNESRDADCKDAGAHLLCRPPAECEGRLYTTKDCTPPDSCKPVEDGLFACDRKALDREDARDRKEEARHLADWRRKIEAWQNDLAREDDRFAKDVERMTAERARSDVQYVEGLDRWEARIRDDEARNAQRVDEAMRSRSADIDRWEKEIDERREANLQRLNEGYAPRRADFERRVAETAANLARERDECLAAAATVDDADERETRAERCHQAAREAPILASLAAERVQNAADEADQLRGIEEGVAREKEEVARHRAALQQEMASMQGPGLARQLLEVDRARAEFERVKVATREQLATQLESHRANLTRGWDQLLEERARYEEAVERLRQAGRDVPEPLPPLSPRPSLALPSR